MTQILVTQLSQVLKISRKGAKGQSFNTLEDFATRLWQARNDCGLLRIGRREQRKLRNFTALAIKM